MRDQLKALYEKELPAFQVVRDTFPEDDLPGPLLMMPPAEYTKQPKRLMIVGQETKGWSYHHDDIDAQFKTYEEFALGKKYYASPFWNVTRKLERILGNKEYSCAWTNINKFDFEEGRPYGKFEQVIQKLDRILLDELQIVLPQVCMFFTGPHFDWRLKDLFPEIKFTPLPNWKVTDFCLLEHPSLPYHSYRSSHPRSLRMRRLEPAFIAHFDGLQLG